MDYETARTFADTWGLLLLVVLFAGVLLYVFRRGSSARYRRAARIPLNAPESPAESDGAIDEIKSETAETDGTSRTPASKAVDDQKHE